MFASRFQHLCIQALHVFGDKKVTTTPPHPKPEGAHKLMLICLCCLKVSFLKDRVMAEQVAKDSVEAMLQGDVDNIRAELGMKAVYNLKEVNLLYMSSIY